MKNTLLSEPVTLLGHTFFGRRAKVSFIVTNEPGLIWFAGGHALHIDRELASVEKRRLELHSGEHCLSIVEHLLALRWLGLSCGITSKMFPYFSTAGELWKHLQPLTWRNGGSEIKWVRPKGEFEISYPGDLSRSVSYWANPQDRLDLEVTVDFPGIGNMTKRYVFPDKPLLRTVLDARPLAWPPRIKHLARLAQRCGWPHFSKCLWAKDSMEEWERPVLLHEICDHRAQDILGALALVHHTKLPAIHYVSHCAGHWADMQAVQHFECS